MFKKGKNNINWKGGVYLYKNHSLMKRNRLLKLNKIHWRCEECGEVADRVHHIDGTKHNHHLDNLMALCLHCHWRIHTKPKNKNKNFKPLGRPIKYGLKKLATKYNMTIPAIWYRIKHDIPLNKKNKFSS